MAAKHSPGRVVYDDEWHELKLEENGYVIARLPRPHPQCRGKERAEESATIRANGERLAALWNAALSEPKRYALNPDNGLMYESERGPWVRAACGVTEPQPAHSKSEYKRRVAMGDPNVAPPSGVMAAETQQEKP